MITLYHSINARSFRPLWLLEEMGVEYELMIVPFPPRIRWPAILEVNPRGTVPALVDGSTVITESSAILEYLAARHGHRTFDVSPDEREYAEYLELLHLGEATLTFPLTIVLRYSRFETDFPGAKKIADDYRRWFLSRLKTLEPVFAHREFAAGERFTAADVSLGYALFLAEHLGLADAFKPELKRYWAALRARPGFRGALEAQSAAAANQGMESVPAPDVSWPNL